jgi:4-hydroxythreonine-4-phosphate dehydrogenase
LAIRQSRKGTALFDFTSPSSSAFKSLSLMKYRIGLTIGDANGIGPEIIYKLLSNPQLLDLCTPIVYGHYDVFETLAERAGDEAISFQQARAVEFLEFKKPSLITCWDEDLPVQPGQPTKASGRAALLSLQRACQDLKNGLIDAIVTAPIDKENIQAPDFAFAGHTEFLASFFGVSDNLMLLTSDILRVALVTGHVPLRDVASRITVDAILKKAALLIDSLRLDFGLEKPRVAVLGLNPHAGDRGLIGKEEQEVIIPAIRQLKGKGHLVFGPYPADGFFASGQYREFDAVLAMYHDQGLIPFKSLAFHDGVNFTAGLPIVRTSPDHGTAFDIAGRGVAREDSIRQALYLAIDVLRRRREEHDLQANRLEVGGITRVPASRPRR